jgi:hypothetical protein
VVGVTVPYGRILGFLARSYCNTTDNLFSMGNLGCCQYLEDFKLWLRGREFLDEARRNKKVNPFINKLTKY